MKISFDNISFHMETTFHKTKFYENQQKHQEGESGKVRSNNLWVHGSKEAETRPPFGHEDSPAKRFWGFIRGHYCLHHTLWDFRYSYVTEYLYLELSSLRWWIAHQTPHEGSRLRERPCRGNNFTVQYPGREWEISCQLGPRRARVCPGQDGELLIPK